MGEHPGLPVWTLNQATLSRRAGAREVLLPPDADDVLIMEGTATAVWRFLHAAGDSSDLLSELVHLYGGEASGQIMADVAAFLRDLEAVGAVWRQDGPG